MRSANVLFSGAIAEALLEADATPLNARLAGNAATDSRTFSPSDAIALCLARSLPARSGNCAVRNGAGKRRGRGGGRAAGASGAEVRAGFGDSGAPGTERARPPCDNRDRILSSACQFRGFARLRSAPVASSSMLRLGVYILPTV